MIVSLEFIKNKRRKQAKKTSEENRENCNVKAGIYGKAYISGVKVLPA